MKDPLDVLSQDNIESFREGYTEVVLKAGTVLHRFTQGEDAPVFSDCWIDHDTFSKTISDIQRMASELGMSADNSRKRVQIWEHYAILSVWNRLSHRVKISLKKDVIGYVGKTGSQSLHMALDQRSELAMVPSEVPGKATAFFSGTVVNIGGTPPGVRYVLIKDHVGKRTQRLDNLSRVDVKLNARVEQGQVIGQSVRVTKRAEYRMGGFQQHVIPRFRKDENLRKVRGFDTNDAAEVLVNQPIF